MKTLKLIFLLLLLIPLFVFGQLSETNVSTTAVGNAIGNSSRAVSVLCTGSTVNKWSRKKPVLRHNTTESDWYKEYNGKFSLVIPTVQLPSLTYASSNAWTYTKPTSTYGFRLGDFRGYLHTSVAPFYTSAYPTGSFGSLATSPQWVYLKNNNTALGITSADLAISTYYYGIMVEWVASGYTNRWAVTDTYDLANANKSNLYVDLTAAPFVSTTFDGTFRWTSFVSASAMTTWTDLTTAPNYTVIPTPGTSTGTFTAYKQNFDITPGSGTQQLDPTGVDNFVFGVDTWSTNGWTATLYFPAETWCSFTNVTSPNTASYNQGTGDGGVELNPIVGGTHIRYATITFVDSSGSYPNVVIDLQQQVNN